MKKKHNGETPTDDTSAPYEVGYCKPPKHTRFRPGQSGNPKGRPKGRQNPKTLFNQTLNETVAIREGERTRRVSKLEAFFRRTVNEGLQGDARKSSTLISLCREMGVFSEGEETTASPPYQRRRRNHCRFRQEPWPRQRRKCPRSFGKWRCAER